MKRILSLLLVFGLLLSSFSVVSAKVNNISEAQDRLTELKSVYHGKFWTGKLSESALVKAADSDLRTDSALGLTKNRCGSTCSSNTFQGSTQCKGFARFLEYYLWGEKLPFYKDLAAGKESNYTLFEKSSLDNLTLQTGDFVFISAHAAVVWKYENGELYFAEVWGSSGCEISFGKGFHSGGKTYKTQSEVINMVKSKGGYVARYHKCPPAGKNSKGEWNYQTYNGKVGVCKECKTPYKYTISKSMQSGTLKSDYSSQKIKVMSEPYEDAACIKNGVIKKVEVTGVLYNAYDKEWYEIDYADSSTNTCYKAFVYAEHIDKYYDLVANNHRLEGGNFIEDTSSNQSSNNTSSNTSSNNTQSSNNNTQTSSSQAQTITAPQQPTYVAPSLTLSTYSMEIDHVHESSRVITVNVSGTMPQGAYLNAESTPGTTTEWGSCVNGKADLTIIPNWKLGEVNSTVTISLKDGNNNVILQKQLVVSTNAEKYTVRFDANGGSGAPSSMTAYRDAKLLIPFECPSREGYKFVGWSESRNSRYASYDRNETYYFVQNTTLYAVWEDMYANVGDSEIMLSFDKLFMNYNSNRTEKIIVRYDLGEDVSSEDCSVELGFDEDIDWELGKYYGDADGYWCREFTISVPKGFDRDCEGTVYIKDKYGKTRVEESFEICYVDDYTNRYTNGITVYLDGKRLDFDVQPSIINGRTMVPMRKIFEEIGALVYWDNKTQTAFGETVEDFVAISIGDNYLEKNGEFIGLDSPATIISGRTLVPARAIAESFNCDVDWIGDKQIVTIECPKSKYKVSKLLGEWSVMAEIDDYLSFYEYDRPVATFEFQQDGIFVTYHETDEANWLHYEVTKGGFIKIRGNNGDLNYLGSIQDNDTIYIQEAYEYTGNGLSRWTTSEGDTFIQRQYDFYKKTYLEDDDGIVLVRK